jgi:uncharacterized protein YifE (UPF0438 family)
MTEKNLTIESFQSTRLFTDDQHYPRGIGRSGDYSIAEVNILETYGVALLELSNGQRQPQTDEEHQFIAVVCEQQPPSSKIEKAWMKYLQKTRIPKTFHTLFGKSKVATETSSESDEQDTVNADLDMD